MAARQWTLVVVSDDDAPVRQFRVSREAMRALIALVLFLIAVRMIFPQTGAYADSTEGEPLVVPLAIPLIAGPSTLATLLLLRADTDGMFQLWLATTVAWGATAAILIAAPFFYRALGERGLVAMERLMGLVLVMISVHMCLNGVATFMAR